MARTRKLHRSSAPRPPARKITWLLHSGQSNNWQAGESPQAANVQPSGSFSAYAVRTLYSPGPGLPLESWKRCEETSPKRSDDGRDHVSLPLGVFGLGLRLRLLLPLVGRGVTGLVRYRWLPGFFSLKRSPAPSLSQLTTLEEPVRRWCRGFRAAKTRT